MKITLEPTDLDQAPHNLHPIVSVATSYDDMTIEEMFEGLIIPALQAIGFQQETIDKYLGVDNDL